MRPDLAKALSAQAEDFDRFTSKIAKLRGELQAKLGVDLVQETDMNYSASQRLRFYLAKSGSPTLATSAKWHVDFFLSSKGPLFTYVIFEQQSELGNLWQFKKPEEEPP